MLGIDGTEMIERKISVDLGGGNCEWTDAVPAGKDANIYGTLFASYPANGMRVTWQHTEGISGVRVGDDFHLGEKPYVNERSGLIKTQYPHLEGIWSWGSNMDQVVLVIRNPRWAIPSYHTLLHEIYYAHDWETAYKYLNNLFNFRAPIDKWIKWRDYRFDEEIDLWMWHIDFWMEGGTQYWMDLDYERNGQYPFRYLTQFEKDTRDKDLHCIYDMDCFPKAVVTYEKLIDPDSGPSELTKIAEVLRNKEGMEGLVGENAIACVWHQTWEQAKYPFNSNRDKSGPRAQEYLFTVKQMEKMLKKLLFMIDKYSSGHWANHPLAMDLVASFNMYFEEVTTELEEKENTAAPPTRAPTPEYHKELITWYSALGRGNRYDKAKVQQMYGFWPLVAHLYKDTE